MEELKATKDIRVRFAPAPTGPLHIGITRAALFNYLFARQSEGKFILRIEDTDLERSDPKWEKDIIECLRWLGIEWDEGPIANAQNQKLKIKNQKYIGDYGPYRQKERIPIYTKYLEKLLNKGKAYYCFCPREELEALKQYQLSIGQAPRYNGKCRQLSEEEVKKRLARGEPSIIRFKIPAQKVVFQDLIRGRVEFDSSLLGDIAIAKDLAAPLYNFAVVVDDFEMKVSHVIRGEDHIANTPKQILIQEALDFPRPQYAHLPLILGPDRRKLSKREMAVGIAEYRRDGYLAEALVNFMAFLGWNPGTEKEIFSLASLVKEFSLKRVQKGGAIFNIKRLDWFNGFYIRQKPLDKLTELCLPYLIENCLVDPILKGEQYPPAYGGENLVQLYKISTTQESISFECLKKIVGLYQERLKKLSEISELTDFFFKEKLDYNKDLLKWKDTNNEELKEVLNKLEEILSKIKPEKFGKENLEKVLLPEAEQVGDRGKLLWPLRVVLSGKQASAGPFEIAEVLGKEKTLKRIKQAKLMVFEN